MTFARVLLRAAACALAVAACLLFTTAAAAQGGLTLRAGAMAGYTHERPETLGSEHDVWASVLPEMMFLVVKPRWQLRTSYQIQGTVHTRNPNGIAQRLNLASSYELSSRTQLLLGLEANQSTLSNYLLTRPLATTPATVLPLANTNVVTAFASQGIAWEATPRLLFTQTADAAFIRSLDEDFRLQSYFANVGASLEYVWPRDALGVDARVGFAETNAPPLPEATYYTATAAPRWRHDFSETWSSSLSAGATLVLSPSGATDPLVTPYGRAALLYTQDTTNAELAYTGGVQPNLLSGQLLNAHQVTLRAGTPISEHHRVYLTGSIGYLRGQVLVLDDNLESPPDFDAFLSNADVTWLATDHLQVFGRYQFFGQFGGPGYSFLREAVIAGIQISSQPPDGVRVPTRFAQRVDRSDARSR